MKSVTNAVKAMCEELLASIKKHRFETLADFKRKSLDYFTTHAELVRMQREGQAAAAEKAAAAQASQKMVAAESEWSGDEFVKQSHALARATRSCG